MTRISASFAVLALVFTGCAQELPSLAIDLRTDYVPLVEFAEVRVTLEREPDDVVQNYRVQASDLGLGQRVAFFDTLGVGDIGVVIELFARDGRRVGRRQAVVALAGSQTVTLLVSRACSGILCDGDLQCAAGRCVEPRCTEQTPEYCGEPDCNSPADCDSGSACTSVACSPEGSCFYTSSNECGMGAYCDPQTGCQPSPLTVDGGEADAARDVDPDGSGAITADAGPDGDTDGGTDAGPDTGPADCGQPCDTENVCEQGRYDCSTGAPVCVGSGPKPTGYPCREAAGVCDIAELCDGVSNGCPGDVRAPNGVLCRGAVGECDVSEACDGEASACPVDSHQPVGRSCADGFCDESHECSNTCTPGASCVPTNICRRGRVSCDGGAPQCDEVGDVASGASCGTVVHDAWSVCSGYSGACDETGTRSRRVRSPECSLGECGTRITTETEACMRTREGASCGDVTYEGWGSCSMFSSICDTDGRESRVSHTPICTEGMCGVVDGEESRVCFRVTSGDSCGGVSYGAWEVCRYSSPCDETGSRERGMTIPECSDEGTCGTRMALDSEACMRLTTGLRCGSISYGPWSVCGGFSDECDTTGSRSRTVDTPSCLAGLCRNTRTVQNGTCTRVTVGDPCLFEDCALSSCNGAGFCHPAEGDPCI